MDLLRIRAGRYSTDLEDAGGMRSGIAGDQERRRGRICISGRQNGSLLKIQRTRLVDASVNRGRR